MVSSLWFFPALVIKTIIKPTLFYIMSKTAVAPLIQPFRHPTGLYICFNRDVSDFSIMGMRALLVLYIGLYTWG
jgi:hypothetical protein